MKTGVLYQYDKNDDWVKRITGAIVSYHSRLRGGLTPNEIHIHPDTDISELATGFRVVKDSTIRPGLIWIGRAEK